jgi:hemerythrin
MNEIKYLDWQERWSLDIISIDEEHKLLIDLVNTFIKSISEDVSAESRKRALQDAIDHFREHFAHEELIMRNIGYKNYLDHKSEHDDILIRAGDIMGSLDDTLSPENRQHICDELYDWIVNHLTHYDISIRSHIEYGH